MSLQLENPVIFGLRELYNSSPEARQIISHFSGWKEDRKVTGVKRVLRRLSRDGSMLQRPQIEQCFQVLHAIGLGEFISGEGVRRPRFVWGYPLRQLSHVATGEAWELEPLPAAITTPEHENGDADDVLDSGEPLGTEAVGTEAAGMDVAGIEPAAKSRAIKHAFRLREDLSIKFRLPRDLTMTEAVRLAEFIKALPFGP
jgi:hypothetical protein